MRRWRILTVLAGAIALGVSASLATAQPGPQEASAGPLSMSSIKAVFLPASLATEYSVDITDVSKEKQQVTWSLQLKLVDPANSSPPGNLASHAEVDPSCNNAQLKGGEAEAFEESQIPIYNWTNVGDTFTWYHGDEGSYPGSDYGCDHTKMGPSGHEGEVDVVVISGIWQCYTSIRGTNLSPDPVYGAKPICRNLRKEILDIYVGSIEHEIAVETGLISELAKGKAVEADIKGAASSDTHISKSIHLQMKTDTPPSTSLDAAASLDEEAAAEDLTTEAGRKKATTKLRGAVALKKEALADLKKLIAEEPH